MSILIKGVEMPKNLGSAHVTMENIAMLRKKCVMKFQKIALSLKFQRGYLRIDAPTVIESEE